MFCQHFVYNIGDEAMEHIDFMLISTDLIEVVIKFCASFAVWSNNIKVNRGEEVKQSRYKDLARKTSKLDHCLVYWECFCGIYLWVLAILPVWMNFSVSTYRKRKV